MILNKQKKRKNMTNSKQNKNEAQNIEQNEEKRRAKVLQTDPLKQCRKI